LEMQSVLILLPDKLLQTLNNTLLLPDNMFHFICNMRF
jgi:hypothetical protein